MINKIPNNLNSRVQKDLLLGNMYAEGLKLRAEEEHTATLEPARIRCVLYPTFPASPAR